MASIFSTQNLHTFLRRKNFRPPSRGPPGPPPGSGPVRGPRGPPSRGPLSGRDAGASAVAAPPAADVLLTSSAMLLLLKPTRGRPQIRLACFRLPGELRGFPHPIGSEHSAGASFENLCANRRRRRFSA